MTALQTATPPGAPPNDAEANGWSESREPKEAWVPLRPAPGSQGATVFGAGFFRRFGGAGCFLSTFTLVGSLVLWAATSGALVPYGGPTWESDPAALAFVIGLGAVFVLGSLAALRLHMREELNKEIRRGLRSRPEPWTWDHPWQPRGMGPDYRKRGPGDALGGLAVLSLIALFNFALPHVPWWPALIILAFDAFGLLLLYDFLARLQQSLRFPLAVVAWPTFPVRTGGRLEASVRFRAALQSTGPAIVTVRCVRDGMGGGTASEQDLDQVRAVSIYRATRSLPAPAALRRLDIAFDVPGDLPGTNLTSENPVYWQLLVRVPISGPDFETVFLAPVYSAPAAVAANHSSSAVS